MKILQLFFLCMMMPFYMYDGFCGGYFQLPTSDERTTAVWNRFHGLWHWQSSCPSQGHWWNPNSWCSRHYSVKPSFLPSQLQNCRSSNSKSMILNEISSVSEFDCSRDLNHCHLQHWLPACNGTSPLPFLIFCHKMVENLMLIGIEDNGLTVLVFQDFRAARCWTACGLDKALSVVDPIWIEQPHNFNAGLDIF